MPKPSLIFDHAIRFPDGRFYTGRSGDGWAGPKHEAFTYTAVGAESKLINWNTQGIAIGATVVKLENVR